MSCPFSSASGPAPHPLPSDAKEASRTEVAVLPQPPEHLLGFLGNIPDIEPAFPSRSFWKLAELYGPIFKLKLREEFVVVSDQKHVNEICDENRFEKVVNPVLEEIRALLKDGLFTAYPQEQNWWKAHRILIPVFGPMSVRRMFPEMIDIASQMVLRWDRQGKDHQINLADDFTRLAFDTIGLCAFSYRFNEFYSDHPHPFARQMADVLLESGKRGNRPAIANALHKWSEDTRQENVRQMHALCDEIVAERKRNPQPDSKDLLQIMLTTADPVTGEKLSDENIRYNLCTFLLAGHETTSSTLAFCFYNLLKNPEKLLKAQQQVDEIVGDGVLELRHLSQLTYVDACIKETLRLSSPINAFNVHAKEDTMLDGKYPVSKNTVITALLRPLHRDPAAWGDDAEVFRPERMLNGGFEKLPPNSWKPFGNGMRACIGRTFAEQEMIINIALILQRFQIEFADPSYELQLKSTLTIKPADFKMKARRRPGKTLMTGLPGGTPSQSAPQSEKNHHTSRKHASDSVNHFPISIFYGGNSGTCKSFAEDIETRAANYGVKATVASLDSATEHLPTDHPVIIITASYEGKPPDNARKFVKWLEISANEKRLDGVKYAVFGVGNSDWATTYHKIPKLVDRLLGQMGGQRLMDAQFSNVKTDPVGPFEDWSDDLWTKLRQMTGSSSGAKDAELEVSVLPNPTKKTLSSDEINSGTVLANYELASADIGPAKKHIEIRLPEGTEYSSGDYLVVLPRNPPETVQRVLQRFELHEDDLISISNSKKKFLPLEPESAIDLFTTSVELSTPVTRRQFDVIAAHASPDVQSRLQKLSEEASYGAIIQKRYSILDILDEYHVNLPLSTYLDMLTPLTPRQYSISSSPLASRSDTNHPITTVSLTYDVLEGPAWSSFGTFHGVASTYLASRRPGDRIACFVRPTSVGFRLPTDPKTPVIMMAAGTGIAPMMAFIQERAAIIEAGSRELGPAALFFGCRDPDKDFLYRDQLREWEAKGVVKVYPAFSRKEGVESKYVQDAVWAEREVAREMFRNGGKIYICGSAERLAKGTSEVCKRIHREGTECTEAEAEEWLERQREERYIADVY